MGEVNQEEDGVDAEGPGRPMEENEALDSLLEEGPELYPSLDGPSLTLGALSHAVDLLTVTYSR